MLAFIVPLVLASATAPETVTCETATAAQAASGAPFFINAEAITFEGATYSKFGLPRVLLPGDVVFKGDYMGVLIGVDAHAPESRDVIYLLSRADGCEFQPYWKDS